jgi:hypothetical protein
MTPHETLINVLGSAVLTLTPSPFSPLKTTGVLKEKFGYELKLPIFGEVIEGLMKEKNASPPDLILTNDRLKMVVAIECKSDFNSKTIEKLSKQVEFYSSETFRKFCESFVSDLDKCEIWIVTYSGQEKLGERISGFIEKKKAEIKSQTNIIVWEVEIRKTEEAVIRKIYGEHQDFQLNGYLQTNGKIETSLPQIELLIDSSLSYSQRVARIGRRIFSFIVSKSLTSEERVVSLSDFKEKFGDAIMTDKELANCFRYLTRLIPEIGSYITEKQHIVLRANPPLSRIKAKIEDMESVTDEEFKTKLITREKAPSRRVRGVKKPKSFKGVPPLEKWLKKNSSSINRSSYDVYTDISSEGSERFSLSTQFECMLDKSIVH